MRFLLKVVATPYVMADETLGVSVLTRFGSINAGNAAVTIPAYSEDPCPFQLVTTLPSRTIITTHGMINRYAL